MGIVVIGCGRVGSALARNLAARRREVAVVDVDPSAFDRLGSTFAGTRVAGSATDRRMLVDAGIEEADALAVVTGSDDVNAVVARLARHAFHVPRVVARLHDPRTAEAYERLGIRTIAPVSWAIARFGDLLTFTDVTPVVTLGTGGVEVVEVRIPGLLHGRQADELRVPGEVEIVAVTRHGRTSLARATTVLEAGDLAQLAVTAPSTGRLDALLGHP